MFEQLSPFSSWLFFSGNSFRILPYEYVDLTGCYLFEQIAWKNTMLVGHLDPELDFQYYSIYLNTNIRNSSLAHSVFSKESSHPRVLEHPLLQKKITQTSSSGPGGHAPLRHKSLRNTALITRKTAKTMMVTLKAKMQRGFLQLSPSVSLPKKG